MTRRPGLRRTLGVLFAMACAACAVEAGPAGTPSFENVSIDGARELPPMGPMAEGRPGGAGGTILAPASAPIEAAVAYRFNLGHCGLSSPIDVDGSFWVPLDGVTAGGAQLDLEGDSEMINATPGFIVVIGDEARFRTQAGAIVSLARHVGEKEYPGCD